MRRFAPVRGLVRELFYGPEPVGHAGAARLQQYSAGGLQGGALGGLPHVNMRGEATVSFTGLIESPQRFIGNAQMGANRHATVQEYAALPNAAQPEGAPSWFRDFSSTESVLA